MKKVTFGTLNGVEIIKYTLSCGGMEADVMTYGATLTALRVPDREGKPVSVVFGHETLEDYLTKSGYHGATVGRFANRIGKSRFVIDGVTYHVSANEGANCLHGGKTGLDKRIWTVVREQEDLLQLHYLSPDGEEGFPGNLDLTVTYRLTAEMGLVIEYDAVSDKDTVISLTNHSYYNVGGVDTTTAGLLLHIDADRITPADEELIPHGEFRDVEGTLFDFRAPKPFVGDLSADPVLGKRGCYDENFVLNGSGMRRIATLEGGDRGLKLEVFTDQPGMQIYTGNPNAIALETQNFPNAVNCPQYPSPLLRAGEHYRTSTEYRLHNV
ncbi:MAG: galactose mutarotase [Ruminococcaceae bacterium]|nr:galactose mutarotase [Oscillospiraceae bacterium]